MNNPKLKTISEALGVFALAFSYYFLLACKEYTNVFASGDSGDWLASARLWFVPQPYGSPLYITLAKVIGLLCGDLAYNMTVALSVLSGALAVMFIFMAVKALKGDKMLAVICSLMAMGAAPLLTQSTVLEEYALAAMFVSGAIYFWVTKRYWVVMLFMGLASAVHIIPVMLTLCWGLVEWRKRREWLKYLPIYLAVGILPYALILWLMKYAEYRWLAGGLTLETLNSYLGSTKTTFSLSIYDTPRRLWQASVIILASYGMAIIPIWRAIRTRALPLMGFFCLLLVWFYFTDVDFTTWTFLIYTVPPAALLCAVGIRRMERPIVTLSAVALLALNGWFLNAEVLNNRQPQAREFYADTLALPDNAVVITSAGGFLTLGMFHAIAEGKPLQLNFITEEKSYGDYAYETWSKWMDTQGLIGRLSVEKTEYALETGQPVFRVIAYLPELGAQRYVTEPFNTHYQRITAVSD